MTVEGGDQTAWAPAVCKLEQPMYLPGSFHWASALIPLGSVLLSSSPVKSFPSFKGRTQCCLLQKPGWAGFPAPSPHRVCLDFYSRNLTQPNSRRSHLLIRLIIVTSELLRDRNPRCSLC